MKLEISGLLQIRKRTIRRDIRRGSLTAIWPMTPVCDTSAYLILHDVFHLNYELTLISLEDERSIANKLAREEKVYSTLNLSVARAEQVQRLGEPEPMGKEEAEFKKDPTLPVCWSLFSNSLSINSKLLM